MRKIASGGCDRFGAGDRDRTGDIQLGKRDRSCTFKETYPALSEIREPIETAICEAAEKSGPNLDQGFRGFPIAHLARFLPGNAQI